MRLFDLHTLDFRPWWIRAMDRTGDLAVLGIKRTLSLENLRVDRRRAIEICSTPAIVPWAGLVQVAAVQRHRRDVYRSSELLVMLYMERDTLRDGINWKLDFSIFGHNIMYKREQLRIAQAIREFAAEQSHLHDLVITPHINYIQITLRAQIGHLTESA